MRTIVVLQARTTSSRLPGKAMLPVAGYPSAILAALRASNRGVDTLMATSLDPSDDVLADNCHAHQVTVFRGPLDDVLSRYCLAISGLPDDCVVVRLTGDNVVPDGWFVEDLVSAFAGSKLDYLAASPFPCGLGGEAFTAATLRRAHDAATSPRDREHVGLWMNRHCRAGVHIPPLLEGADCSRLRCTIDVWEDYQRILRLFEGIANPIEISYPNLIHRLASFAGEPFTPST